MRKCLLLLWALFSLSFASNSPRVVAYSYMTPVGSSDLDYSKVTHLIGSFVNSDINGNLSFQSWTEADDIVAVLKEGKTKGAIPMIAVGTTVDTWEMTKSATARATFIDNLLTFCDTNGIEGIDLDLEGVAEEFNWGNPGTFFPEPYESLAVELRLAMPDTMLLTSAVGSHSRNGAQWTDRFLDQLDFINVMIYDRALSWEQSPVTNHSTWESHASSATYWHVDRGLPREKISLGLPFYARGWDIDNGRIYKENPGWEVTTWDYKLFADRYSLSPEIDSFEITATDSLKYKRADGVTGRALIFFNGQDLIGRKTQWTIDSSYGGVMIWHIGADVPTTQDNSLLAVIDSVITNSTPLVQPVQSVSSSLQLLRSRESVSLGLDVGSYEMQLVTMLGRVLYTKEATIPSPSQVQMRVGNLAQGLYFLKVRNRETQEVKSFDFLVD